MLEVGEIISHTRMCLEEGLSLQRGMNFRVNGERTIILMSQRNNAPYRDQVQNNGETLIYEGHDVPKNLARDPKSVDQPRTTPSGRLTENGKFENSVHEFKKGKARAELIRVYEKIKPGIWVYNGVFELVGCEYVHDGERNVFQFELSITDFTLEEKSTKPEPKDIDHNRMIPSSVKLEVWKRDAGKCRQCGSADNLHFDHILPFSKGGTSLKAENIQLLCARHNLSKSDKII